MKSLGNSQLPKNKNSFLCKIGLHKWGRAHLVTSSFSNINDYQKRCHRCGKIKRWTKAK